MSTLLATDRLVIRTDGRILFLSISDIEWVQAAGNYVELHLNGKTVLTRETLSRVQERLPADRFLRIHRSVIVNMDRIVEMEPGYHGDYVVTLRSGAKVTLSRGYRHILDRLLL